MKILFFYFFKNDIASLKETHNLFIKKKDNSNFLIINETNYTNQNLRDHLQDQNILIFNYNLKNTEYKIFEILKDLYDFYKKYDYILCFNSKFYKIDRSILDNLNEIFLVIENKLNEEYSTDFFIFKPNYNFFAKYNYFFLNKKTGKITYNLNDVIFYNMLDFLKVSTIKL